MLFDGEKRLVLLDCMALIYRAHFALIRSPRFTSAGFCTSAVFGVTNTILDILDKQSPTHIAGATDLPEPTHRHQEYAEYKATRQEPPEDLAAQLPYVDRLLQAMNIPIFRKSGFEADDIIATLASQAEQHDFLTLMVTPDKDFQQLVTERTLIFKPGRKGSEFELWGVDQVLNKWNIQRIEQVTDILGLMGDSSDNIPGIPGIGEKTAQKLIQQFDSMEHLLAHTEQLKGKQRERVEQHAEQALLSKRLVQIQRDVPIEYTFQDLERQDFDKVALKQLFQELEFDSLGKRLFGKSFSSAATRAGVLRERREKEIQQQLFDEPLEDKTIQDVPHTYHIVDSPASRRELVAQLQKQTCLCFDTEATGKDPRSALPLGLAFSYKPHHAYYVPCSTDLDQGLKVLEEFRPIFEDENIEKVGHNLKYDVTLLKWHGIEVRGTLFDTMLAHSMKEPEMRHGLDYLSKLYLGYYPIPLSRLIGKDQDHALPIEQIPLDQMAEYAAEDADVTLQLAAAIRPEIESRGVGQVCYDVECPLIPVLVDMEHEGIRLDTDALYEYSKQLNGEIDLLRSQIFAATGHEFNIDSPKQLGTVLYDELHLDPNPKKTPTGQYSTREPELLRLSGKHQIVRDVLEYRHAVKLKSVYVDQLPDFVSPTTGRLHTHYSQSWTATGRMQSNNPNLQTIPVRKERGREIRAAFVPRDDRYAILSADYSQIELRVMAALSQDETMLKAFEEGIDIHRMTAAQAYKCELDHVTREMRDKAKMVNFGIIYGISAFGLQQRLNIPRSEATQLIDNYFEKYPGVRRYVDDSVEFARKHGYVKTQTGRRRYIRDINSRNASVRGSAERLAMNSPIQGTAADMLKLAMIRVHEALRNHAFKTKMLLTVHDEIVFDLFLEEQDRVLPIVEKCMREALPLPVPIVVELGIGKNWLEAH